MGDKILLEAERLYKAGYAVHWLHNKSKRPIESGWTTGPRKKWAELLKSYRKGMNVGVRLGKPSQVGEHFLAVLDVDVKSTDPKHGQEVTKALLEITKQRDFPEVKSGRGNGSKHYYLLTKEPAKPLRLAQSSELVKVPMPSVAPSKRELSSLTPKELSEGLRLRPAWEIALMGDGQQVVLPPSIHPDSGKEYAWVNPFSQKTAKEFDVSNFKVPIASEKKIEAGEIEVKRGPKTLEGFEICEIDLFALDIDDKIAQMILTGEGVEDRSAMLLPVCQALLRAKLTQNEILSVLTDPNTYMGQTGYHHAKTNNRYKAAAWIYRYSLSRVVQKMSASEMFKEPFAEQVELSPEQISANQDYFETEIETWRMRLDTTKDDSVKGTLQNVVAILENEIGEDFIARDTFALRDFYRFDTPWKGKNNEVLIDDDIIQIKLWLSQKFKVEPNNKIIGEALTIIAKRNAFDPVVQWLDSLPEWDYVDRLDGWLKKNFSAQGDEDYLAQVFRKWIVAMVMRAYRPGTKFDWMPIFEGAQGVGKSSFGRMLCGDGHFLDWLPDLSNKDAALALQGIWTVEMGELASFRKNEIEAVKAFLTRTVDKVRPPYGERWLEIPRRCVFFGTTNYETYLRDDSGNRRFKPVKVGALNFEALRAERDQLFAEAKFLFQGGLETEQSLEIEGRAKLYEKTIQADKMVADESALMLEVLMAFIDENNTKEIDEQFDFKKFQMRDLFSTVARSPFGGQRPFENWKFDSRNAQFAGKALKLAGFEKMTIMGQKYWKTPK